MRDVYILGIDSTQFKKWPEKTFKDLTKEAYVGALRDAGLDNGQDIGFSYFANCQMHHWNQGSIRGQVCFIPLVREGLFPERVPIINVEGGCASGSMAFHLAWKEILSGQAEVALAIGVEKTFIPDNPKLTFDQYKEGFDTFNMEETYKVYNDAAAKCGREFNYGPNRTLPMDTYATQACYHMWRHGTTQRQIACGASKNHYYGSLNPKAQYNFEVPVEEVLNDREISYPLTRSMCAPIGDGAAGAILCSEDYLRGLDKNVRERAIKIRASVLTGGKYRDINEPSLSRVAADKAYVMANVRPEDIDVAEVHDATSFCEIYQMEMLRFCPIGQGGPFVESGETKIGGKIPTNTSGGLVSKGHPIGATGISMLYELCVQLRGEAGERQVKNAKLAIQENGGGILGLEEAACSIAILERT